MSETWGKSDLEHAEAVRPQPRRSELGDRLREFELPAARLDGELHTLARLRRHSLASF